MLFAAALMALAGFASAPAQPAQAQSEMTTLVAVHGIDGESLGAPQAFPVDVKLSSDALPEAVCVPNFEFAQVLGPVELPAGAYDVEISPATGVEGDDCSNPPVLSASGVSLMAGESYSAIAYLTNADTPMLGLYVNGMPKNGRAQVAAYHAAQAPAVDVSLIRNRGNNEKSGLEIPGFVNGDQAATELKAGKWTVSIAAAAGGPVLFEQSAQLFPFNIYLFYAIGSFDNGSFQVVSANIPLPKEDEEDSAYGQGIVEAEYAASIGDSLLTVSEVNDMLYLPALGS
jgi:hypothetical protein